MHTTDVCFLPCMLSWMALRRSASSSSTSMSCLLRSRTFLSSFSSSSSSTFSAVCLGSDTCCTDILINGTCSNPSVTAVCVHHMLIFLCVMHWNHLMHTQPWITNHVSSTLLLCWSYGYYICVVGHIDISMQFAKKQHNEKHKSHVFT